MFRIKICGLTTVDDALSAVSAGADAIGLNFVPSSPRFIDEETAERIVLALPKEVAKVGVFANSPSRDVAICFDRLGLDLIQLHGSEPPAYLAELDGRPVMKAFRGAETLPQRVADFTGLCLNRACSPRAVLVDAIGGSGQLGGTGQLADWNEASKYAGIDGLPPLVLAGGLKPENIAAAIRAVRPTAVDTASGVESSPGRKDAAKLKSFVIVARETFGQITV